MGGARGKVLLRPCPHLLCAGGLAPRVAAAPPVDDCGPIELGCGDDLQWAIDLEDAIRGGRGAAG